MSFSLEGIGMQKVGSQETPGVTGKFGLGVQNEAGQRLIEFCQENQVTGYAKSQTNHYTQWKQPVLVIIIII